MEYLNQKLNRDVSKPSCLYIMADGKIERHAKHPSGASAKSIDFQSIDKSCGFECQEYYFAKVSRARGGGAQDNQWADVRKHFIDGAKKNLDIMGLKKVIILLGQNLLQLLMDTFIGMIIISRL